ncbi:hypothetical protein Tco_0428359 [Tanacetum coccineum]
MPSSSLTIIVIIRVYDVLHLRHCMEGGVELKWAVKRIESVTLERCSAFWKERQVSTELSSVYDKFHVSNLKKCLADANLHVLLEEIKVDKTLHFVEDPIEIMDREVKKLKRSRIPIVMVCWYSKGGPEFT